MYRVYIFWFNKQGEQVCKFSKIESRTKSGAVRKANNEIKQTFFKIDYKKPLSERSEDWYCYDLHDIKQIKANDRK